MKMALGRLARRPRKYFTQGRIFVESGTYASGSGIEEKRFSCARVSWDKGVSLGSVRESVTVAEGENNKTNAQVYFKKNKHDL